MLLHDGARTATLSAYIHSCTANVTFNLTSRHCQQ